MSAAKKPRANKEQVSYAPEPTGPPADIDVDFFVKAWNASQTLKALAAELGVSASTCATNAARLRKEGHALKWFRKGRPRLLKM